MLLRWLHAAAAVVFALAIVVQVVLAGLAISNLGGSGDFSTHIEFGYTGMGLAGLALVVTALLARRPRRDIGITLGLLVLYVVQTLLPSAKGSAPFIAALHPLNAMILFVLAIWYARRAWPAAAGRTVQTTMGG
jgi:hypothetical protein